MNKKYNEISKFLSYVLRHQPEAIGISLDKQGWAMIDDLILCASKEGYIFDRQLLLEVVANSDKRRFKISEDNLRIRASQGHSTQKVDIIYQEKVPPTILYHGTARRFLSSIQEQGLVPKTRQYVHLSADEITATQVGQRHGQPIVLKIKALNMYEQGFKFFLADNGVWLTRKVSTQFIIY